MEEVVRNDILRNQFKCQVVAHSICFYVYILSGLLNVSRRFPYNIILYTEYNVLISIKS